MERWLAFIGFCLSLLTTGCKSNDKVTSCAFYEEHYGGSTTSYYFAGQKAAQQFRVIKNATLKRVIIKMDLLTSSSINFSILKELPGATTPAGATVVTQATLTSGSVPNSGKITFSFPQAAVEANTDYYFVLEAIGGDIELTDQTDGFPANVIGEIWRFNGAWTSNVNYDFSFSVGGDC